MSRAVFTRSAGMRYLQPFRLKTTGFGMNRHASNAVEPASDAAPTWAEEKRRYLNMSISDKRKEYVCGTVFYKVRDIKTWRDYVLDNKNVATRIPALPGVRFDTHRNFDLSTKVSIFRGDITTLEIDAIVNAANKSLRGGMGVDGAIHRAAGPFLLEENKTLNGCAVGEAKITGGYKLPAKYVIPTVGPQGEKPDLLRACYRNAMQIMFEKHLRTIAFPCISTGIYGYPLKSAAHVAIHEVRMQLEAHALDIDRVIFCLFSESDEETYQGLLQSYFPLE